MEIPVRTRSMAMPTERATPMERACRMEVWEMEPIETSSTCLMRTWTAGSAATMKYPMSIPMGMRRKGRSPWAMEAPMSCPADMKPTFTPVRKHTRPTYVYTRPLTMRSSCLRLKRRVISWKSRNMAQMGTMDTSTSRA